MTGLLGHALHLSWGIVDTARWFAVLVFAGDIERLVEEDFAGFEVGGDGLSVVDEQFGHAAGIVFADVEDPAHAGDVVLRDAAAPIDLVRLGLDVCIPSNRGGRFQHLI